MKKSILVIGVLCICFLVMIPMAKQPIITFDTNEWNLRYEPTISTHEPIVLNSDAIEQRDAISTLLHQEKGWLISDAVGNFFLGGNQFTQEDSVITIFSEDQTVALYSSGVIWDMDKEKYVYLNLFQGKDKGKALYEAVYGLLENDLS